MSPMAQAGPGDDVRLAAQVLDLLGEQHATLAVAESLTGGRLAALVTSVSGASLVFLGGVVSYAAAVKIDVLGVSPKIVEQHGVVSAECASAMASGVRDLLGSTHALATTGVAGPGPADGRPAGTVFVAVAGPDGVTGLALELSGDRSEIADRACHAALSALSAMMRS